MDKWWQMYILVAVVAATGSFIITAFGRRLAPKLGFLDKPLNEAHKRHEAPMPVFGGVTMFLAWGITLISGLALSGTFHSLISSRIQEYLPGIQTLMPQLVLIASAAAAIMLLGMADDRWGLGAFPKFAGQFLICAIVAALGPRITLFWENPFLTWGITVFWLLVIINAINFFDNMDGLAGGVVLIATALFTLVAGLRGQHFVATLGASTAGVVAGFLPHNTPPARIFMGDAGSHFLGLILGIQGTLTTFYMPGETQTGAPLLIPLLILGVPLFDLCAVIVIRLHYNRPLHIGDHTHISHRFAKMGLTRGKAVLLVHLLMFTIGAGAITLLWLPPAGTVIIFLQALAVLTVVSMLQSYTRKHEDDPSC
mgnify:CR=1 FL=1